MTVSIRVELMVEEEMQLTSAAFARIQQAIVEAGGELECGQELSANECEALLEVLRQVPEGELAFSNEGYLQFRYKGWSQVLPALVEVVCRAIGGGGLFVS